MPTFFDKEQQQQTECKLLRGSLDAPLTVYLKSEKRELPRCSEELKSLIETHTNPVNFDYPMRFWLQLHNTCLEYTIRFAQDPEFFSIKGNFHHPHMQTFIRLTQELHTFKSKYEDCLIYNYALTCMENDNWWRDTIYAPVGEDRHVSFHNDLFKPLISALSEIRKKVTELYDNKVLSTDRMPQFDGRAKGLINFAEVTWDTLHGKPLPVSGM